LCGPDPEPLPRWPQLCLLAPIRDRPPVCASHHEVENEEELVILSNNLLKLDDTGVVELSQRLDLSQAHALIPGRELLFHLLDGNLEV
jgi:hypothetical protein